MPLQLQVQQKELSQAMQLAARALSSKPSAPILGGILLEAQDNRVTLRSTDLELSLLVGLEANIVAEGRTVLSGHLTADAVRHLPDALITLEQTDQQVLLRYNRGKTVLSTYDPGQFPVFPEMEEGRVFRLTGEEWQEVVKQVLVACGHDEVQPLFNGVLWEYLPGKPLTLVATDTHRLAMWQKNEGTECDEGARGEIRAVVPRRTLEMVARLAQGMEKGLEIKVGKRQVGVEGDSFSMVSRLIEAKYPNYRGVIPAVTTTRVEVDRASLVAALERAALLVREEEKARANVVRLEIGEGSLTLSGRGAMGSIAEPLEAKTEGVGGEIYFNVRYLLDGLKALMGQTAAIKINAEFSAAILQDEDRESYIHLVLPVVIKENSVTEG